MTRTPSFAHFSCAMLAVLVGCRDAHRPEKETLAAPDIDRAIDDVVRAAPTLSGTVVVADARSIRYARVAGFADRERGLPHSVDEVWRWASVTKQVSALLVMQDIAAERLSLDDSLASALPSFAGPTAHEITIRDLLRHTSGLPNPNDTPATGGVPAFYAPDRPPMGMGYCAGPAKRKPHTDFEYNNCDYLLVGAILERNGKSPFRERVSNEIAAPLHLTSIGKPSPVVGYVDGRIEAPEALDRYGASGELTGTIMDLVAFDRALMAGDLLDRPHRDAMWTGDPKLGYVALGAWAFSAKMKGCEASVKLVERRGQIGGIQVRNILAPEQGVVIVVMTNNGDFEFGEIWQGRGFSHDLVAAALCRHHG